MDTAQLEANVASIRRQIFQFFHNAAAYLARRGIVDAPSNDFAHASQADGEHLFRGELDVRMVNNFDWYRHLTVLDFLATVGRYARVNDMLSRDSVKNRITPIDKNAVAGLSFTEFSYQLMQAHDFSILHRAPWHCYVQLGGSDQMGNINAGIDLIRRQRAAEAEGMGDPNMRQDPAYGLTLPLLTTASGAKFGKSAGNAVWISRDMLSDLDFYQYFVRSADTNVERYLRSLTLLPANEIDLVMSEHDGDKSKRVAQIRLAEEMTELVRGEEALRRAQVATRVLFATDVRTLTLRQVQFAFADDPRLVHTSRELLGDVLRVATESKLVSSRSEARRLVQQGGLHVNGSAWRNTQEPLTDAELLDGCFLVLRAGRTNHRVVVFT